VSDNHGQVKQISGIIIYKLPWSQKIMMNIQMLNRPMEDRIFAAIAEHTPAVIFAKCSRLPAGNYVRIDIEDQGLGIREEYLDKE
jgi:hypothetical protein